jgi:hypothetical protein
LSVGRDCLKHALPVNVIEVLKRYKIPYTRDSRPIETVGFRREHFRMTEINESPDQRASNADFEQSLQADIKKLNAAKLDWSWINLPFTLWALSAIGIGFLSFWFQAYSSCAVDEKVDNLAFSKLFLEIYQRRDRISLLSSMDTSIDGLNSAITALDPDSTYIFSDYKGKKLLELTVALNSIAYKWKLLSQAISNTGTTTPQSAAPSTIPDFNLTTDYWTEVYQRFATTSGNLSSTLLIDAQAASKNPVPSKLNDIITQIRSVATTLKNDPEFATFLRQQDVVRASCTVPAQWQD